MVTFGFGVDHPLAEEIGGQGVIRTELMALTTSNQVRACVANVRHRSLAPGDDHASRRTPHAGVSRIGTRQVVDLSASLSN